MWCPSEIVAIVLLALIVGGIRLAQRFDPAFNVTWLWRPHPPWRWVRRPSVALPWLLPALHLLAAAIRTLLRSKGLDPASAPKPITNTKHIGHIHTAIRQAYKDPQLL